MRRDDDMGETPYGLDWLDREQEPLPVRWQVRPRRGPLDGGWPLGVDRRRRMAVRRAMMIDALSTLPAIGSFAPSPMAGPAAGARSPAPAALADPRAIVAAMSADVRLLAPHSAAVDRADLRRFGWADATIDSWFESACAAALQPERSIP